MLKFVEAKKILLGTHPALKEQPQPSRRRKTKKSGRWLSQKARTEIIHQHCAQMAYRLRIVYLSGGTIVRDVPTGIQKREVLANGKIKLTDYEKTLRLNRKEMAAKNADEIGRLRAELAKIKNLDGPRYQAYQEMKAYFNKNTRDKILAPLANKKGELLPVSKNSIKRRSKKKIPKRVIDIYLEGIHGRSAQWAAKRYRTSTKQIYRILVRYAKRGDILSPGDAGYVMLPDEITQEKFLEKQSTETDRALEKRFAEISQGIEARRKQALAEHKQCIQRGTRIVDESSEEDLALAFKPDEPLSATYARNRLDGCENTVSRMLDAGYTEYDCTEIDIRYFRDAVSDDCLTDNLAKKKVEYKKKTIFKPKKSDLPPSSKPKQRKKRPTLRQQITSSQKQAQLLYNQLSEAQASSGYVYQQMSSFRKEQGKLFELKKRITDRARELRRGRKAKVTRIINRVLISR